MGAFVRDLQRRLSTQRHKITSAAVFIFLVILAQSADAQVTKTCFPTCSERDGRFLSLVGTNLESLAGDEIVFSFRVPSTATTFQLDIFDGETSGYWDKGSDPVIYTIFADPDNDGQMDPGETVYGPYSGATMTDNAWYPIIIPTSADARNSGSGAYFYTVRMRLQNPLIPNTFTNFKIRANADILLQTNNFAFAAPLFSDADAEIIYPNYDRADPTSPTSTSVTTYDGSWRYFMLVEKSVVFGDRPDTAYVDVWDGDMDFGSYDCSTKDTDDPNTPNAPFLPSWAVGTTAVPEGIAHSEEKCRDAQGNPTGGNTTGDPSDDNINPLYRRSPSITYTLIGPNGAVYANTNPSGNKEWERFSVSLMGGVPMVHDYQASSLPDGIYEVRIAGMDMNNLNAWHSTFRFVGVCPDNYPCPTTSCPDGNTDCQLAQGATARHRMILAKNGTVWTWGKNSKGQLGDGTKTERCEPVRVLKGEYPGTTYLGDDCAPAVSGGVGRFHSLVAMGDGLVYSWGSNHKGQLGTGATKPNDSRTPVRTVKGEYPGLRYLGDVAGKRVIQVAAGRTASMALTQEGIVYAWGENKGGELGNGDKGNKKVTAPIRVLKGEYVGTRYLGDNPANPIVQISMGDHISVALAKDGSVYTWGEGKDGQSGNGALRDNNTPVRVLKGEYEGARYLGDNTANPVTMVSAGGAHMLALTKDGRVWAWGTNKSGALGVGEKSTKKTSLPVKVAAGEYTGSTQLGGNASNPIVFISAGGSSSNGSSFAVADNGPVFAWGSDHKGKLAVETKAKRVYTPTRVDDGDYEGAYFGDKGDVKQVSAHYDRSAGLVSSCTLYEWGEDKGKLDGTDDEDIIEDGSEFDVGEVNNDNSQVCKTDYAPDVVTNYDGRPTPKVVADDEAVTGGEGASTNAPGVLEISSMRVDASSGMLHMTMTSQRAMSVSVELFSINGERIATLASDEAHEAGTTGSSYQLPSNLPSGMYIVRAVGPAAVAIQRFQITR